MRTSRNCSTSRHCIYILKQPRDIIFVQYRRPHVHSSARYSSAQPVTCDNTEDIDVGTPAGELE
jgi:hypothetical protein